VLLLAVCLLVLLLPLLLGRWPAGLLLQQWRWPGLIWVTLVLQAVVLQVPMPHALASVVHVATYAVAIGFLWMNRRFPGALLVGGGAASNGLTIAVNGGVLPASPAAVDAAGLDHGEGFSNSAIVADPVLPWLGDVFAWPAPLPLANTFSVGDVLIVAGVALAAWSGTARLGRLPGGAEPTDRDSTGPGSTGPGSTDPESTDPTRRASSPASSD
jgi:hypothetical protein